MPFGDRELWFFSALSSLPGMAPAQEANCVAEGNAFYVHSYFGDDLLGRVHPQSRHLGQSDHRLLVLLQRLGGHPVQALDLPVQQLQTFQIQLQDLHMHRLGTSPERIDQFLPTALQPVVAPLRQFDGIGLPTRQRLQDPPSAGAQQIADHAR